MAISVLAEKLAAKTHCTLSGYVVTDFVVHMLHSDCRLAILTAAGINHRLELPQGFRCKIHRYSH